MVNMEPAALLSGVGSATNGATSALRVEERQVLSTTDAVQLAQLHISGVLWVGLSPLSLPLPGPTSVAGLALREPTVCCRRVGVEVVEWKALLALGAGLHIGGPHQKLVLVSLRQTETAKTALVKVPVVTTRR